MEKTQRMIMDRIANVYARYQQEAETKNEQKRKKAGLPPDKEEARFFQIVTSISKTIKEVAVRMSASRALEKNNEMKTYANLVGQTATHIENIRKNKAIPLKVNEYIMKIADSTAAMPSRLIKSLDIVEQPSGFCCGSNDGKKNFRNLMMEFGEYVAYWRMLDLGKQKQNSDNYIVHRFDDQEYSFVMDILRKNWPEVAVPETKVVQRVVEKQVPVQVQVVRYVETGGKPNRLSIANEWMYGINRQFNPTLGLQIYHEEADKLDNPAACNIIGSIYERGDFLQKDQQKAFAYYKKSYSLKDARGMYLYAKALENGLRKDGKPDKEDLNQAFKLITQSAEANCLEACVDLGYIYENGCFEPPNQDLFKTQKDLRRAMNYYLKARNERSPKASNNIGVFYLKNKYIDDSTFGQINTDANCQKNLKNACKFLEEAANRGFPTAYYNLGTLYERGEGVQQNPQKAKDLFYEGAMKGDIKCKIFYSFYLIDQTSIFRQNFDDEYRLAVKWLEDVISESTKEEETAKAYYYLGLFYEYGFGVDCKPKKAVELFQRSALLMFSPAINKLGHCYFSGFGVTVDKMIAVGYYKQAAQQGNGEALVNLGTAYLMGIDRVLDKNPAVAYQYFESAMKAGNTDAYVHLSNMYEKGLFVKKDEKLAHELLMMAAIKKNQTAIYLLRERGEEVDSDIIQSIEQDMFIEPKAVDVQEIRPYIKDLTKASVIRR